MTAGAVSPVPREARPYQGRRAGLVTRLVANTIDALVVGSILVAGYLAFNGLVFLVSPRDFSFSGASLLLGAAVATVVLVAYLTVAWATSGRTYGDHVMGLRVVTRSGARLPVWMAMVRAVFCAFFPIGILWCAVSPARRSVQDVVLRTAVVYDWQPRQARLVGG